MMMEAEGKKVSLRKIAKWIGIPWSTMHYKPHRRSTSVDKDIEHAIYELIQRYPRYGYRRIVVMLKKKLNIIVNRKKVQRIMQRNGWGVKVRFKGFRPRTGSSKSVSDALNHRWATDMTHFSAGMPAGAMPLLSWTAGTGRSSGIVSAGTRMPR